MDTKEKVNPETTWDTPFDLRHKHHIGRRLLSSRLHMGYSLVQLSYRTGLSFQLLEKIEQLDLAVSYGTVERIAEAMNIGADELLNW